MASAQLLNLLSMGARNLAEASTKKPKEEPKDEKKEETKPEPEKKRAGGVIKSSASKRADGIAQRGKTRGKIV